MRCLKYFFILYWKDFTCIFQGGHSRPYWVLLPSKIEEWSHLVNLLVRSTCTLALKWNWNHHHIMLHVTYTLYYETNWLLVSIFNCVEYTFLYFIWYAKIPFRGDIILYFGQWPVAALHPHSMLNFDSPKDICKILIVTYASQRTH